MGREEQYDGFAVAADSKDQLCSKGWLIFWMRPLSKFTAIPQPCGKNLFNVLSLLVIVFIVLYQKGRIKSWKYGIIKRKENREVHVYWNGRWNWSSFIEEILQQTQEILNLLPKIGKEDKGNGSHFCDQRRSHELNLDTVIQIARRKSHQPWKARVGYFLWWRFASKILN